MLPQELVDRIVGMVGDTDVLTLKACALASASLCSASQPILFRSLTLKSLPNPSNYVAASTLLTESPHIGTYFTDVKIGLPSPYGTTPAEIEAISRVLAKLTKVRRCIITGEGAGRPGSTWDELGSILCPALLDFVFRQTLESLTVCFVQRISPAALACFITSAPTLSFSSVSICGNIQTAPARATALPHPPSVNDLVLDEYTLGICNKLLRPEYAAHIADLRRVSVRYGFCMLIVHRKAGTLQHIRIGAPMPKPKSPLVGSPQSPPVFRLSSLPPLTSLLSFDIQVNFNERLAEWISHTITTILDSKRQPKCCNLEEVTITYLPEWSWITPGDSYATFLTALDGWISTHTPCPRLRWRIRFVGTGREERFAMLTAFIADHMPRVDSLDCLVFDTYEPNWNDG
ncbi:hypothetical protein C8R44DRAFT_792771, partial [Mycena epipterygia]